MITSYQIDADEHAALLRKLEDFTAIKYAGEKWYLVPGLPSDKVLYAWRPKFPLIVRGLELDDFSLFVQTVQLAAAPETAAERDKLKDINAELLEVLREIAEGKGPFDPDPLQHATNAVFNMVAIAKAAIAKATE